MTDMDTLMGGVSTLGDKTLVRVCGTPPTTTGHGPNWAAAMDKNCGQLGIVLGGRGTASVVAIRRGDTVSVAAYAHAWLTVVAPDTVTQSARNLLNKTCDEVLVRRLREMGAEAMRGLGLGGPTVGDTRVSLLETIVQRLMEQNAALERRVCALEQATN